MSQPKSELTLALDGEITASDLAEATATFNDLLQTLQREEAAGASLEWIITDLRAGSSSTTARCRAIDPADELWIPRVIAGGQRFAEMMEGDVLQFPPALEGVQNRIRRLIRGRVIRVRFETPDRDFTLAGPRRAPARVPTHKQVAFGSVRGRVQALSSHGSLRFTLYDFNDDKAVSCYLPESEDSEARMINLWGRLVEVEGYVRRDLDGKPLTIRGITDINPCVEASWKAPLRALPGFLGNEPSEDVIRRSRDA